jgi:hypothetical protein
MYAHGEPDASGVRGGYIKKDLGCTHIRGSQGRMDSGWVSSPPHPKQPTLERLEEPCPITPLRSIAPASPWTSQPRPSAGHRSLHHRGSREEGQAEWRHGHGTAHLRTQQRGNRHHGGRELHRRAPSEPASVGGESLANSDEKRGAGSATDPVQAPTTSDQSRCTGKRNLVLQPPGPPSGSEPISRHRRIGDEDAQHPVSRRLSLLGDDDVRFARVQPIANRATAAAAKARPPPSCLRSRMGVYVPMMTQRTNYRLVRYQYFHFDLRVHRP